MFYTNNDLMLNCPNGAREIFVDDSFFTDTGRTKFVVNKPVLEGKAFTNNFKIPHGNTVFYNIVKNEVIDAPAKYFIYYICTEPFNDIHEYPKQYVCVLYTDDGIKFKEPNLGLLEYKGNKNNNAMFNMSGFLDGFCVFIDTNPNCDPNERYKATFERTEVIGEASSLYAATSPDGLHWTIKGAILGKNIAQYDTLNCVTWNPILEKYVVYLRKFYGHVPNRGCGESNEHMQPTEEGTYVRGIAVSYSDDFENWTTPTKLSINAMYDYQLYNNNIVQYNGMYLGFPTRYFQHADVPCTYEVCRFGREKNCFEELNQYNSCSADCCFMCSRDGVSFKLYDNDPFIESEQENGWNWRYRECFMAHGFIENEDKIYCYSTLMRNGKPELMRYSFPIDRYAGISNSDADYTELTFNNIKFDDATNIAFNFKTSGVGSFKVQITDVEGNVISGYSYNDCYEIFGNTTFRQVRWKNKENIIEGIKDINNVCKVQIKMRETTLYAVYFI